MAHGDEKDSPVLIGAHLKLSGLTGAHRSSKELVKNVCLKGSTSFLEVSINLNQCQFNNFVKKICSTLKKQSQHIDLSSSLTRLSKYNTSIGLNIVYRNVNKSKPVLI